MADTGTLTVDDLRTLERSIMESPSCANSILKLLDALTLKTTEDGNDTWKTAAAAMHSLRRIFSHYCSFLKKTDPLTKEDSGGKRKRKRSQPVMDESIVAARLEYNTWLTSRLDDFLDVMLSWLGGGRVEQCDDTVPSHLREQALRTLMHFVERQRAGKDGIPTFCIRSQEDDKCGSSAATPGLCSKGLFAKVVSVLLSLQPTSNQGDKRTLEVWGNDYVNSFDDVRFHCLRNIISIAKRKIEGIDRQVEQIADGETNSGTNMEQTTKGNKKVCSWAGRAVHLLMTIIMVEEQADLTAFLVSPGVSADINVSDEVYDGELEKEDEMGAYDDENDVDYDKATCSVKNHLRSNSSASPQKFNVENGPRVLSIRWHRKAFSDAWLAVLCFPLPEHIYRDVLMWLPKNVVPYMGVPVRLGDFYSDSYSLGGVHSILALDGLLMLMTKYNLDYPKFYDSLLRLITPATMHARYRGRLLRILDTCLTSEMLSAALIARFVKRLCRVALECPPANALFALAMVDKLLSRHEQCKILIRYEGDGGGVPSSEDKDLWRQPVQFLPDNVACIAVGGGDKANETVNDDPLKTSLWEVATLRHHYYPAVKALAMGLQTKGCELGPDVDMEPYMSLTYKALFDQEISRKLKTVPLAIHRPSSALNNTEEGGSLFDTFALK
eukprot:217818_1